MRHYDCRHTVPWSVSWPFALMFVALTWQGVDWTFVRDLSGLFTYYGAIPSHYIDNTFGLMYLSGGWMIGAGLVLCDTRPIRIGAVLGGMASMLFSIGFFLQAIIVGGNAVATSGSLWSAFSAATPGFSYMALGMLCVLAGVRPWVVPR